jgi:transcriptional regulator of acetoin/glycerol metabolism
LSIGDVAMNLLCAYDWPGNVRELRNVIENAIVFTEGNLISEDILPSYIKKGNPAAETIPAVLVPEQIISDKLRGLTIDAARKVSRSASADSQRDEIMRLLEEHQGNISSVARQMGLSRNTVYRKMRAYKIDI